MNPPPGIRRRPRVNGPDRFEFRFTDQHGKARSELRDTAAEAARDRKKRLAEVRAGTYIPPGSKAQTIGSYAEHYFAVRDRRRTIEDDRRRFELHVVPHLGARKLVEVQPVDVATWVAQLKAARELSAKSICNAHGVLQAMLGRAHFEGLIPMNPAKLPKGMLPKKSRKPQPRFDREQVIALLTDERIARDRRMLYALMALTGMRRGEACGRRVRDLDLDAPVLASLLCDSQYDDQPLKTSEDDDAAERVIPVHPALRAVLDEWLAHGFRETYGRAPLVTDWLVPDPRTGRPRTENQAGNALRRDCERVLDRGYGSHPFRRAFISLARSDGARHDVLERVTHNARGEMIDVYTSFEWPALCEAVQCLRLVLSGPAAGPELAAHNKMGLPAWRRRESNRAPDPGLAGVSHDFAAPEAFGAVAKNAEEPADPHGLWAQDQITNEAPASSLAYAAWSSMDVAALRAELAGLS